MNRQVIAFLSLFSLVLVLSVYYVLVPVNNGDLSTPVNLTYEETRDAFFVSLNLQKEANQLEFIDELSVIISSTEASNEEKAQATLKIDAQRDIMQQEQEVGDLIKQAGYQAAYVEIKDTGTLVVAAKTGGITSKDAATILQIVMKNVGGYPTLIDYDNPPATFIR